MELYKKIISIAGVGILLGSTSLLAKEESARSIISKVYQTMDSMNQYSFKASVVNNESKEENTVSIKVNRPNQLRVNVKGTVKDKSNYLNNGCYTMMDHNYGYYAEIETPKNINDALDFIFEKYNIHAPLAQLVYTGMNKRAKFNRSKNFGKVNLAGIEYNYLAFRGSVKEIHLWVTIGKKPMVKYYSVIDRKTKARVDTIITWNKSNKIKADDFIFTAPKNASKIIVVKAQ